jgi:hypothetical protein
MVICADAHRRRRAWEISQLGGLTHDEPRVLRRSRSRSQELLRRKPPAASQACSSPSPLGPSSVASGAVAGALRRRPHPSAAGSERHRMAWPTGLERCAHMKSRVFCPLCPRHPSSQGWKGGQRLRGRNDLRPLERVVAALGTQREAGMPRPGCDIHGPRSGPRAARSSTRETTSPRSQGRPGSTGCESGRAWMLAPCWSSPVAGWRSARQARPWAPGRRRFMGRVGGPATRGQHRPAACNRRTC